MRELDHDDLRYSGRIGEEATVTVEPQNTVQLVTYTLKGVQHSLPPGQSITFNLESQAGGQPVVLQMNFDYSNPNGGRYRVVVRRIENEENNECVHVFKQRGSNLSIKDYRFFVS
jgi:hypothetical protein